MALDKQDFEYPDNIPSFEDVMIAFAEQNPEYKNLLEPRTRALVEPIFLDKDQENLPDKIVQKNMETTRVRIFYILKQLEESTAWQEELASKEPEISRVAASDKEFEESSRTFFKTLQEVLSQPTERLAVQRDDEKIISGDLTDIIIDPSRITPKLLENLGLAKYLPPKGARMSPAKRLAYMAQAIPEIKEMLASAEPLSLPYDWHESQANYFRLMRIGAGKNRGYILGTQVIQDKKVLFKTDLHGAYRRLSHIIQESYREERRILTKIQSIVRQIHKNLGRWPMSEDEIVETREKLMSCVDSLKHVTNEYKSEMRRRIANAVSLKSERVIPPKYRKMDDGAFECVREEVKISAFNPGAKRASLVTIPGFVEKRKEEIKAIIRHLAIDQVISDDYISQQQEPLEIFYETVEKLSTKLRMFSLDEPLSDKEKVKIAHNLQGLRDQCDPDNSITRIAPLMEPYLAFGEKMVEHSNLTIESVNNEATTEDRVNSATEFMKIYVIAKIQHFYISFQKVYEKYLSPKELPNFGDLHSALGQLSKLIGQKRINGTKTIDGKKVQIPLETPEYNAIYHKIYQLISELRGLASAAKNFSAIGDSEKADVKRIKQEMKDLIKSFRFDDLIRNADLQADDSVLTTTPIGDRPTWPSPSSDQNPNPDQE